ncbi:MAG TPA: hypothetical protein PLE24_10560 [Chitinispirillaceae bacterium]|nr:hypothetical protein [Chitinispirillaceae bacterium]
MVLRVKISGVFRFFLPLLLFSATLFAKPVQRVDLYDESGNHLMFVMFEYGPDGRDTARSVYMSDSTFVRRTVYSKGSHTIETSFNFNNDTVFSTMLGTDGDKQSIVIRDQFGVDQLGSPVSFTATEPGHFDFFQNNALINKINYEKSGSGEYTRINVLDNSGSLQYYATLTYEGGSGSSLKSMKQVVKHSMRINGKGVVFLYFNLPHSSNIKCELISLSGRKAGVLVSEKIQKGPVSLSVSISKRLPGMADGVYLASLAVDGKRVIREKVVLQGSGRGF